jgi:hypothetical protein
MLEVITYQDWRKNDFPKEQVIVTVSKSKTWSVGLSPFKLGPCELYDGHTAKNVENAWQFSKVYPEHIDEDGTISDRYFKWAENGWSDNYAKRYPMGKGAIPEFSYWNGERLSYVEARKKIYIPLYYKAVKNTEAFAKLKSEYERSLEDSDNLYLLDFDAYRHNQLGMTYKDVVNCETRKMGHAFVLAMALEYPDELERAINARN